MPRQPQPRGPPAVDLLAAGSVDLGLIRAAVGFGKDRLLIGLELNGPLFDVGEDVVRSTREGAVGDRTWLALRSAHAGELEPCPSAPEPTFLHRMCRSGWVPFVVSATETRGFRSIVRPGGPS